MVEYAHEYIIFCIPGVFFEVMFDLKKRFLNCMGISWIPMLAQNMSGVLHVLWCYLCVTKAGLGVKGLGLATAITNLSLLVMVTIYASCIPSIQEALFCIQFKSAFKGWKEYLGLGLPATVMLCSEFWAFEILIFLAGILGVQQ